jgi:ABC-type multidrug transport system ATPase subunit
MDEAGLCDRIALMQHGRILQTGTPAGIVQHYNGTLYRVKADDAYRLLTLLRTHPNTASCFMFGEFLHVQFHNDGKEELHNLRQYLAQGGVSSVVCEKIPPTVEDCFIKLLGNRHEQ